MAYLEVNLKIKLVFLASFIKSPYLCIVFFIVLDLRLTKFGSQRRAFFMLSKSLKQKHETCGCKSRAFA